MPGHWGCCYEEHGRVRNFGLEILLNTISGAYWAILIEALQTALLKGNEDSGGLAHEVLK